MPDPIESKQVAWDSACHIQVVTQQVAEQHEQHQESNNSIEVLAENVLTALTAGFHAHHNRSHPVPLRVTFRHITAHDPAKDTRMMRVASAAGLRVVTAKSAGRARRVALLRTIFLVQTESE